MDRFHCTWARNCGPLMPAAKHRQNDSSVASLTPGRPCAYDSMGGNNDPQVSTASGGLFAEADSGELGLTSSGLFFFSFLAAKPQRPPNFSKSLRSARS